MKRKTILLFAAICLFGIAGCGKKEQPIENMPVQTMPDTAESIDTETEPTVSEEETNTGSMMEGVIINDELEKIENQSKKLDEEIGSSSDQLVIADESYKLWDDELNLIWRRLKEVLSDEEMSSLVLEERKWINEKEEKAKNAGLEYEGGSIQSMIVLVKKAKLTRDRVYELAAYLGEKTGQAVNVPEKEDYSGWYVDTQGTGNDIYSELELEKMPDGTYKATIGLYRLTTLEGIAEEESGYLTFEDAETKVKGDIMLQDGGMIFRVTSSEFAYLNTGDVFEFKGQIPK
jgi:uncharacterized protein YecT (DUF1311 family)